MEPIRECPHCGEPTVPNRLADGHVVCSCAAERELPGPRPVPAGPPQSGRMAVASISSRASGSASAEMPSSAMAGKLRPITER